jgi:ankyrin repeat protein
MKKLFLAIRQGDLAEVKALISKDPELVNCVAKQPPKKDDGQSPLQVAFKSNNFDVADYLIAAGADVNFIEATSINDWKAPVIHDAIMAVVISAACGRDPSVAPVARALTSLNTVIDKGADVSAQDSHGNNCAVRAVSGINQFCPLSDRPADVANFLEDIYPVLEMLINSGVDFNARTETRLSALQLLNKNSPVRDLLTQLVSAASS